MKDKDLEKTFGSKYQQLCDEIVLESELKKIQRKREFIGDEKLVLRKSRQKLLERRNLECALNVMLIQPLWKKGITRYEFDHPEEVIRRNLAFLVEERDLPVEYANMLRNFYSIK